MGSSSSIENWREIQNLRPIRPFTNPSQHPHAHQGEMLRALHIRPRLYKSKSQRNEELLAAAADGDAERCLRKLSKGADVNCVDEVKFAAVLF